MYSAGGSGEGKEEQPLRHHVVSLVRREAALLK